MQDLSFDPRDPLFEVNGLRLAVQIITFENAYGLHPDHCAVMADGDTVRVQCTRLTWAGGQESAPGRMTLRAVAGTNSTVCHLEAHAPTTIRRVKLVLKGLPGGAIVNLRESERRDIPPEGLILTYPDGWRGLVMPLVVLERGDGTLLFLRSLDTRVRAKAFAFLPRDDGTLDVELLYEPLATEMEPSVAVPPWEIGSCRSVAEIVAAQGEYARHAFGLVPWDERSDVPDWAREISLVAAIHCQHYTGYIFNDYARVLNTLRWLAAHIEPRRILAYLPGWEGRYYWQYGDYRPDPRLGGEEGFAALMRGARELGVRVMPMFGINVVNKATVNYEQWGAPAISSSAGGNSGGGSVDWDASRHYDHGWGSVLNPGAPTWQNRLVDQVTRVLDRYGCDAVFLDISAGWWNDPCHAVYEGTVRLIERIREGRPHVLVAGEGWYDAMSAPTPLVQSGHTMQFSHAGGALTWHDVPVSEIFDRYTRSFAHLCLGDPSRGSTGVHELGYNPITHTPVRKGIIPTLTVVDGTLERAPEEVLRIVGDAREYAARFLNGE